jgi:hypothetical protein
MNFDFNKTISFTFSLIAILLSIVTIIMTKRNVKKQLRVNKLEEILEILHFIYGYYSGLFLLFIDTKEYLNIKLNGEKIPDYLKELPEKRKRFTENVNKEIIINKMSRLSVLSNAYLPNSKNLKNKINSVLKTYYFMYAYVYSTGETSKGEQNIIIPKRGEMERFLNKLESDIIKEMNLGYQSNDNNSQKKYFETQFLKDLESE